MKRSNSGLQKLKKVINILDFFDKVCFYPQKTPIKTKYKCQKTEKVELDNSM